ncbi:S-layer homology domain-containing protein [Domibacillus indicus]|uniref:S-layer homology domain-containing protein n=1 Tax=Domibacillus indicus TaxID=1437523 RepID=UPI000617EBEC|nr:S-layer homology domain-containing protein [Domibacillus indicus]
MKKAVSIMMAFLLLFPLFQPLNGKAEEIKDDVTGITLEKEIRAIINAGIMGGYGNGIYGPSRNVTREEFATFLARALNLPEGPAVFSDATSEKTSLAPYIQAAAAAKIVNGTSDGRFMPKETITRKDMAMMISNAITYLKIDAAYTDPSFTDISTLSSSYKTAIGKSVSLNIIKGTSSDTFEPFATARRDQAAAFVYRLLVANGVVPEEIEPPLRPYQTANIDASGKITTAWFSYETYEQAKNAMANSGAELLLHNGRIIKMKDNSGVVFTRPLTGSGGTVNLYTDPELKNNKTYVTGNSMTAATFAYTTAEVKYVTSTDQYVQVYLGGETYYMKPSDALMVPFEGAKGRGYYQNSGGELVHSIYQVETDKYASYTLGKAPSFMKAGTKYYSWDGFAFYNEEGTLAGRAYQYFQYLSARAATSYTAAELDKFIIDTLAERESLGLAKYKDITKKSKLIGLGATLKKVEAETRVNALLILAMAIHESDYGISNHALTNNNLFGIAVYDSSPSSGTSFKTVEEGVYHLANDYLNGTKDWRGGYLMPNTWRAYGAAPGTKANGLNVKYASDPNWGAKVAGHMYRIDKALGGKDYKKYSIGFTNAPDLNVRSAASSTAAIQFTYSLNRMPVTISQQGTWHKVLSDNLSTKEGYIHSNYVNILTLP